MPSNASPKFTPKQGQYLSFIYTYTLLNRRPPAEGDFQRFFEVTPPTVHQMIVELERRGLISRVPGQPRTIRVTLPHDELPMLEPVKTSAARY
jgi:Mn-dependent DtxR family transcriptional regulator